MVITFTNFQYADGSPNTFYMNTVAVGARKDTTTNSDIRDIQLVQFFLRLFFDDNPALLPRLPHRTGFVIDGKMGNQTIQGIQRFQSYFRRTGAAIFDDARVSVCNGAYVPGTRRVWTIHYLNSYAQAALGAEAFDSLRTNQIIAREAPELSANLNDEGTTTQVASQ